MGEKGYNMLQDFFCEGIREYLPEIRSGHFETGDMIWGVAEIVEPEKFLLEVVINPDEENGNAPRFEYHVIDWDAENEWFEHVTSEKYGDCKVDFDDDNWEDALEKDMTEFGKEFENEM